MDPPLEDFDDRIDEITASIRELQQAFRQASVQKAQCSRVIISCHDIVNKLREAEDDPDVVEAMDKCAELVDEFRSEAIKWRQRLKTSARGLGLALVSTVDRNIRQDMEKLLNYVDGLPSIFGNIQTNKWIADLEKCRVRDSNTNKSHFQALIDVQDETLVLALEDDGLASELRALAEDLDLLEELGSIVGIIDNRGANQSSQTSVPPSTQYSSQDPQLSDAAFESRTHTPSQSRQDSLDAIWSTISKLEEHVGGNPAFEAQMDQLRKLAQAVMISADEAVDNHTKPKLLTHTTIIKSPESSTRSPQDRSHVNWSNGDNIELHVAEFIQNPLQIPPSPTVVIQSRNTHILDYIKSNPSPKRFKLCMDIGRGLAHMHALGIVLGDFAPWNVTVDETGSVLLRELNLSNSVVGRPARGMWRSQLPDARYIPPEIITLPPEDEDATDPNPRKSDVYAFTLLLYEILSGVAPWDKLDIPSIVSQVTRGNRPTRPRTSPWLDNHEIWGLIQRGWDQKPENRPDMSSYTRDLELWKHVAPEPPNHNDLNGSQQLETPLTGNFHFVRKPDETTIMDDLSFDISREVKMVSSLYAPYAHGGFCDIFIGRRGLEKVAMKRLRITTIGDEEVVKKRFIRECEVWRKLRHPHVLEFYGIVRHGGSLFMISPFLDDGDAPTWLQNRCNHRLRIILEAARGCLYLHTLLPKPTVHGDIKGANILIKSDGKAVLSDFGLSKTMNAHTSHGLKDTGTGPYMAPELFAHCNDPDIEIDAMTVPVTKTLETDVFAFGRTAIELLSGQTPYGNAAATPAIWYILLQGKRPARPNTPSAQRWVTDSMWTFINEMTHVQPECRPNMHEIVARLERFSLELDPGHCLDDSIGLEENCEGSDSGLGSENTDTGDPDVSEHEYFEGDSTDEGELVNSLGGLEEKIAPTEVPKSKGILKPTSQIPSTSFKPPRSVQFAKETEGP